jgi:uncharacterized protein YeaO (DUF488 family)
MAVRIVRLGSARAPDEGLRIGTVRFPPRGIGRADLAARDFYDVWLPTLAPSAQLLRAARLPGEPLSWKSFCRRFTAEMRKPEAARTLDLLAALSHFTQFSVGCYCADETQCHRGLLRALLRERGASVE